MRLIALSSSGPSTRSIASEPHVSPSEIRESGIENHAGRTAVNAGVVPDREYPFLHDETLPVTVYTVYWPLLTIQ